MSLSRSQNGFSLTELLIAVALFSIGMLALAGLHIVAMQAWRNAIERDHILLVTESLVERLRAEMAPSFGGVADSSSGVSLPSDGLLCTNLPGQEIRTACHLEWARRQIRVRVPEANLRLDVAAPGQLRVRAVWPGRTLPLEYTTHATGQAFGNPPACRPEPGMHQCLEFVVVP